MSLIVLPPLDDLATDVETLTFLFCLLEYQCPSLVVEAGTWRGHFSLMAAYLLPSSTVWTADTVDNAAEGPDNFKFFLGDFEKMLERLEPKSIGFAFIDSGPPFEGDWEDTIRWRHYQAVKPYMSPGGLIVSHDMNNCDWQHADDIIAEANIRLKGGRGITIYQVKAK